VSVFIKYITRMKQRACHLICTHDV